MATPVQQMREACSRASTNCLEISRLAKEHREAVVNIRVDTDGSYPLHKVSALGDIDAMVDLLEIGAEVDASSRHGRTPLHDSVLNEGSEAANLLLAHGANIDALTLSAPESWVPACETPLSTAVRCENYDGVQALIEAGADLSIGAPLSGAVANENIDLVHVLCQRGASVNARNAFGNTALHLAAASSNPSMAKVLLRYGALVNATQRGTKLTPLHVASAMSGLVDTSETVEVLLAAGASVHARMARSALGTAKRWSPLHVAAADGSGRVYEALLRHGADPDAVDGDGLTPSNFLSLGRNRSFYGR